MTELRIISEATGPFSSNCILIYNNRTRSAILVDPGSESKEIDRTIKLFNLTIRAIILTHVHFDNTLFVGEFKKRYLQRYPPLKILCHQDDLPLWADVRRTAMECGAEVPASFPDQPDDTFDSSTSWDIDGITIDILHTPGHTPGSVCLINDENKIVLTGDTLFANGIGRLDFPESHKVSHQASLQTLIGLYKQYTAYPGHGPATVIGETIPIEQLYY